MLAVCACAQVKSCVDACAELRSSRACSASDIFREVSARRCLPHCAPLRSNSFASPVTISCQDTTPRKCWDSTSHHGTLITTLPKSTTCRENSDGVPVWDRSVHAERFKLMRTSQTAMFPLVCLVGQPSHWLLYIVLVLHSASIGLLQASSCSTCTVLQSLQTVQQVSHSVNLQIACLTLVASPDRAKQKCRTVSATSQCWVPACQSRW